MIILENVSKTYANSNHKILDEINLIIRKNEFVTLGGPSGSGKSTLLRILSLLDLHFEGVYLYENQHVSQNDEKYINHFRKEVVGFIFQDFNLIERYTIYRNLEFPLMIHKVPHMKRKDLMIQALKSVNLDVKLLYRKPNSLSGGQKQRVAIARALLTKPEMIVADEPTGSLDDENAKEVIDLLKSLKTTVIIATHDARIAKLSDRHVHIENGSVYVNKRLF